MRIEQPQSIEGQKNNFDADIQFLQKMIDDYAVDHPEEKNPKILTAIGEKVLKHMASGMIPMQETTH